MKTLTNTADFSDCTPRDFDHYFSGTAMQWQFHASKRRIFIPSGVTGEGSSRAVYGQYLTKLQEWKEKQIPFHKWAKVLSPVVIRDMWFRCGQGVATFLPNLARNLKKSPRWNYQGVQYFGEVDAEDRSAQGLTYWAFRDLYDTAPIAYRPLYELLLKPEEGRKADVDQNGFVVTYTSKNYMSLYFRRASPIGKFDPDTHHLKMTKDAGQPWKDYLSRVLLRSADIRVTCAGEE